MGLGILVLFMLSVLATIIVFLPIEARAEGGTNYVFNTNTGGSGYSYNNYNSNNLHPIPIIYSITPNSVPSLLGNIVVTFTGDNFIPESLAEFDGYYKTTSYKDSHHLVVALNASDIATIGSHIFRVFNLMPGGGTSNGVAFNVTTALNDSTKILAESTNVSIPSYKKTNTNTVVAKPTTPTDNSALTANVLSGSGLNNYNGFWPSGLIGWLLLAILILLLVILVRKIYGEKEYHETPLKHQ